MHIASTSLDSMQQTVKSRKQGRLQFGSSPVTGFLHSLEKQPLAELVFKDIAAFNAPKIALARTWKERIDTATLELSNTTITLLASLALPLLLRHPVSKISDVAVDALKKEIPYANLASTPNAIKLARLGTSFGFFFPFAAAFWAAPFMRNWMTLKRTQSANFESIIGFDGVKSRGPKRSLQEEQAYQKNTAWKIFGSGVALGAASFTGFALAARSVGKNAGKQMASGFGHGLQQLMEKHPKSWNWLFNNFDLKGKSANQIEGWPAQLTFWGLPAYLGWIHGARSEHERRERGVQTGNALFWFFAAPKLTSLMWGNSFLKMAGNPGDWTPEFKKAIEKNLLPGQGFTEAFQNKVKNLTYDDIGHFLGNEKGQGQKALTNLKNWKFAVSGLGIPITALAVVQLINFQVTERKIKAAQAFHSPKPSADTPQPTPVYPSFANQPTFSKTEWPLSQAQAFSVIPSGYVTASAMPQGSPFAEAGMVSYPYSYANPIPGYQQQAW